MINREIQSNLYNLWFNIVAAKKEVDGIAREELNKNARLAMQLLNKLNVPFTIQNQVVAMAEFGVSFEDNISVILG